MLNSSKIIAFAATAEPDKSADFYQNILGLELVENTPYALVFDANGIALRIQKAATVKPPGYTVLGWEVASIANTARSLSEKGVSLKRFPELDQDDSGIWQSPDGTKVAWFSDPDGNICSLTQLST